MVPVSAEPHSRGLVKASIAVVSNPWSDHSLLFRSPASLHVLEIFKHQAGRGGEDISQQKNTHSGRFVQQTLSALL